MELLNKKIRQNFKRELYYGTAFQPLTTAVQTAVTGAGGDCIYYVNAAEKMMFQMKETKNFIGTLQTSAGMVSGG